MEYVVKTPHFALDQSQVALAKRLGISQDFLRLLLGRGMKEEELYDYLHPSIEKMSSPYEIDGMKEAVERIRKAIKNKEKVLIYGDYDCDGICAISTLMLYLQDKLDVFYFIPDRNKDGYGISIDALEKILYNHSPSLVITVDTGITAVEEVEYLKSKGIDTIVTDHHEPQEVIPDCIVVDPKVQRKGFYDLCGAGVALKLVEALSSRAEASKYLDIVAIATIADVVPLKKDNRIIAYYGLKQIEKSPRKGVKMLLNQETVSAQDVMFRLAPRMNAAGRLNSAMKVVGLFLETDYFLLKTLTEELARDNAQRQALCEKAVKRAEEMLKGVDFNDLGIIILKSSEWEPGILGIACARLVEEFKRPAILFAENDGELRGSARSIPQVNIFELLSGMSDFFTAFGGHAQAAGLSMKCDKFDEFVLRANEVLLSTHDRSDFMQQVVCEMELDMNVNLLPFAKELALMEPTGYQNPKPTFVMRGDGLRFDKIGFSQHVKYFSKNIELIGFFKFADCLRPRTGRVNFEVNLDINVFQNNERAQGIIQSLQFENVCVSDDEALAMSLHQLKHSGDVNLQKTDLKCVEDMLKQPFGTAIVCFSQSEYDTLCRVSERIKALNLLVATPRCLNPENCVVICPAESFDFSYFKRIVIAGKPLSNGYLKHLSDSVDECFALGDCSIKKLNVTKDVLRNIYKELANIARYTPKATSAYKLYVAVCSRYKVSESVFNFALQVFDEVGLVKISDKGIIKIVNKSVRLEDSASYANSLL